MLENDHSAMGWTESIKCGCKNPAIVHGRVKDDVEKQMNEKKRQMKIKNEMKIKNKLKIQK